MIKAYAPYITGRSNATEMQQRRDIGKVLDRSLLARKRATRVDVEAGVDTNISQFGYVFASLLHRQGDSSIGLI